MDEQTRGFRSAIFGGFNREDVMHYIEETDTKYYTETAELRSQLTEAQSAMNELRQKFGRDVISYGTRSGDITARPSDKDGNR